MDRKKRLNLISFGSGIDVIAIFFLEKSQIVYRTTLTRPRHYSCLSHKWKQMPTRRREHSRPLILDQTLRQGKKMNGSLFFQKYGSGLKVVASKKNISTIRPRNWNSWPAKDEKPRQRLTTCKNVWPFRKSPIRVINVLRCRDHVPQTWSGRETNHATKHVTS